MRKDKKIVVWDRSMISFLGVDPMDFAGKEAEKKPIIINEERAKYGLSPISDGDIPIIRISDNNKESCL